MEIQVRGDVHGATRGTGDQDERDTETGDNTGQRALLARVIPEDIYEERRPPK